MTWKNHCIANGAVALALTCRIDVALAAMTTAALPDQLEALLPLGRHRGASHWVLLWLVVIVVGPAYLQQEQMRWMTAWVWPRVHGLPEIQGALSTAAFGLALGPLLHVLLDGCSSAGVPVAPFSHTRLRLSLYKTRTRRSPWNPSEPIFLATVLTLCALSWKARG